MNSATHTGFAEGGNLVLADSADCERLHIERYEASESFRAARLWLLRGRSDTLFPVDCGIFRQPELID